MSTPHKPLPAWADVALIPLVNVAAAFVISGFVVLAREIERNPKILLVGQPTRGVDIGAIEFIHKRIVAQRDADKAVLLVSVELDEIFALSDRIIVLCGGRITGERRPEETNAQDLGLLMAGVSERAA